MDETTINAEIEAFVQAKNVDEHTKDKQIERLKLSVHFMATLGVGIYDILTKEQFEQQHKEKLKAYLETLIQPRGKNKGQPFSASVIRDWINLTQKFYSRNCNNPAAQMTIPDFEDKNAENTNIPAPTENVAQQPAIFPVGAEPENNDTPKGENFMTDNETINTNAEDIQPLTQPEASSIPLEDEEKSAAATEETATGSRMGRPRKSPEGRNKKLTIYITEELEEDVKDLARIFGTTTPDYVFQLIEREAKKRAEALSLIRQMRLENS